MERATKNVAAVVLAVAAMLAIMLVFNCTEASAAQVKPLEKGQIFEVGTSTINTLNGMQQIESGYNVFGDKFNYHGEYYYNGSDHPNTVATFIDPDISDYGKY